MTSKINRFNEIVGVLYKYGLLSDLDRLKSKEDFKIKTSLDKEANKEPLNTRIRLAIEELGTTFIKFAQFLSMRPDQLPDELIEELSKMQESVTPVDLDIWQVLAENFDFKAQDVYSSVEVEPLAVASIGQVYRAQLKSGEEVVLKVQKPKMKELFDLDIQIMKDLINLGLKFSNDFIIENAKDMITSLEKQTSLEFDYMLEAFNMERFRTNYKDTPGIYCPKVYREYSNEKIICQEFVKGQSIVKYLEKGEVKNTEIVKRMVNFFFTQILDNGFYHADPHTGNIKMMADGSICLLDYGMMGEVMEDDRDNFMHFLKYMIENNPKAFIRLLEGVAISINLRNQKELEYELHSIFNLFQQDSKNLNMSEIFEKVQNILNEYKIKIPQSYYTLFRTIGMLEGSAKEISSDFNLMNSVKPKLMQKAIEDLSPKSMMNKFLKELSELDHHIKATPRNVLEILQKFNAGEFKTNIRIRSIEELNTILEKVVNRISLTLIAIGLFLGSSMLLAFKVSPLTQNEQSIFGLIGMGMSTLLILVIIYTIFKKK